MKLILVILTLLFPLIWGVSKDFTEIRVKGQKWYMSKIQRSWTDALAACKKERLTLAIPENLEQNKKLNKTGCKAIKTKTTKDELLKLWMGGYVSHKDKTFHDTSNVTLKFTNWDVEETPFLSGSKEKLCIMMKCKNGGWLEYPCKTSLHFVCK